MIWVLMTSHNRRDTTLDCLRLLKVAADKVKVEVHTVLTDDGSTDGTYEAVTKSFPNVTVIKGSGELYWSQGMASSESYVRAFGLEAHDYLLWLNDDVKLDEDALARLLTVAEENEGAVVVGTVTELDGSYAYGGYRTAGRHPMNMPIVLPSAATQTIETFNGNVVLIPASAANKVGPIDAKFAHALGDLDYGLRCGKADVKMLLAPGTFGTCPREVADYKTVWHAWKAFTSKKDAPLGSTTRFIRRHGGVKWPVFVATTYVTWWTRKLKRKPAEVKL